MNFDYKVDVTTVFSNGTKVREDVLVSRIVSTLKDGILSRAKEWVQSDHPRIPEFHHPFKITKLEFNKITGNLETLILKQESI